MKKLIKHLGIWIALTSVVSVPCLAQANSAWGEASYVAQESSAYVEASSETEGHGRKGGAYQRNQTSSARQSATAKSGRTTASRVARIDAVLSKVKLKNRARDPLAPQGDDLDILRSRATGTLEDQTTTHPSLNLRDSAASGRKKGGKAAYPVTLASRVVDCVSDEPLHALVLVAKSGSDAAALLKDYEYGLISADQFASKILWYGYTAPGGGFVVYDLPRGSKLSGVAMATGYVPMPFRIMIRKDDPYYTTMYPLQLSRR